MAVRPFDVARLRNPDVSEKYSVATENRFSLLQDRYNEECTPDELWDQIQAGITEVAEEVVGRSGRKKPPKPWISEEVIALAERKRIARCTGKDQEYKDLKLEVRRRIRCDRRKWLEDKCKHIESSGRNHDIREVFNIIKSIKKSSFRPNQACINAADGTTLTEKEDVLLRWCEYGQQLFGQPSGDQGYTCPASAESGAEELPSPLITPEPVPLLAEVEQAIIVPEEEESPWT
eukprot:scpid39255/ scgid7883/ 